MTIYSLKIATLAIATLAITYAKPGLAKIETQSSDVAMRTKAKESPSEQEAYLIAREAYRFFYPMISMDVTRKQGINLEADKKPGFGPMNSFHHIRTYPGADFRTVVRPNFDTLYSNAWLDLTKEPVVVSVPDTNGRYYLLPMMDMWSDVFASPGWRTSGTKAKNFIVATKSWTGKMPEGIEKIVAPTPYVWIIGRTKTDGPTDYAAVHKIQDGFKITPFSQWGKKKLAIKVKTDPAVDMTTPTLDQVNKMNAMSYFAYGAELMKLHPPHITDWSIISRLKRIGIEPGKSFNVSTLDAKIKQALAAGAADELKSMVDLLPTLGRSINGWTMNTDTMGVYGDYYLKRAVVAMCGLGANQPEDAIYPLNFADADGKPIDGHHNYVLHFNKEDMPPVEAFWSVTMYDKNGFPCANSINRFAISSWMPLVKNTDGSIDLYLQNENPGPAKESNWLPASKEALGITMRLYAPKACVLTGQWNPPAIKIVN